MKIKDYYGNRQCPECNWEIPDDAKVGDECVCGKHIFVNTFTKVTIGYVTQRYTTLPNGTHVCQDQEFIAGEVQYESSLYGDGLDSVDTIKEEYCPFEMVQPKRVPGLNPVKLAYADGVCPDCDTGIPEDVVDGQSCGNCDHVFCLPKPDDG